jgi:CubicO group peptidase (beta-lactamase class C family)
MTSPQLASVHRLAFVAALLILAPSVSLAAKASVPPEAERRAIKHDVQAEIAAGRLNGVAVALASHGRIVWEQGFGSADTSGRKVTAHTPFSIASTSKPFTTSALMTLVAAGKIDLDHPVNAYLGEHKIVDARGPVKAVTPRLLATHLSGLPSLFVMYPEHGATRQPSVDELLRDYGHINAPPGEHYEYSNLGMAVLADVVARRAGMEYGRYLQQAALEPVGLHDSFFDADVARREAMAVRYTSDGRPMPFYLTATPGSGEVVASVHDLARFAMFHLKDHLPDQRPILTDAQIDLLHQPYAHPAPGFGYGMGWQVWHDPAGHRVLYHGGGQTGVAVEFVLLPWADAACIVASNRQADLDFLRDVRDRLLRSVVPGWTTLPPTPVPPLQKLPADYAGTWRGTLSAEGRHIPATLTIDADGKGRLALRDEPAQPIADFGLVSGWIAGGSSGDLGTPDVRRAGLTQLDFTLKRRGQRIEGEIDAWKRTSDGMTILPFWTSLTRGK